MPFPFERLLVSAWVLCAFVLSAAAQTLVNPNISVVGDSRLNFRTTQTADALGKKEIEFEFHEIEVAFNAYLNPYMRADAFIGIHGIGGEVEVEEASITVLRGLPWRLQFKAGKYLLDFGSINTQHPHQWAWLEWPLMHRTMFTDEGLWPVGAQLSTLVPVGETAVTISLNAFSGEVFSHTHDHEGHGSEEHEHEAEAEAPPEIMGSGRLSAFRSLTDDWSAELGGSYVFGEYDPANNLKLGVAGIDLKLKWRPDSYRAFIWIAEAMFSRRDVHHEHHESSVDDEEHAIGEVDAFGAFTSLQLRFRKVWDVGGFTDYTQDAGHEEMATTAVGAWIGFMPVEETARFSIVYRHETSDLYDYDNDSVVLQIVWALGPHKPHLF